MENVKGIVCEIIFSNEENGYTVCELENGEDNFVAFGCLPYVNVGDKLVMTGEWVVHMEYGEQFKIVSYEKATPEESEEILLYLSSGAIKGIKSATAKRIVDAFGKDTLNVIRDEPEKLGRIKGISRDKAIAVHNQYIKQMSVQKIISFFTKNGLTTNYAYRVYKALGDDAPEKIKENPYIICETEGIGFKTADRLAAQMNFDMTSHERVEAAAVFCLGEAVGSGHTYLEADDLFAAINSLTGADVDTARSAVVNLIVDGKLRRRSVGIGEAIYIPAYYIAEDYAAEYLKRNEKAVHKEIAVISDIELSENQKKAVVCALENKYSVITGGPGTGKTTVIKSIINVLNKEKLNVVLAAPTGRAAKRMTQMCGNEAKTIHRLLEMEYSGENRKMVFKKNTENKIEADALIVDEMSMVDILLFYHLVSALPERCKLIMVGDADQLPSVGAGNVLKDIINSKKIETVCLTEIFRQAKESMIVVNAHDINKGIYPQCNGKDSDFFFLQRSEQDGLNEIVNLCSKRLPKFTGKNLFDGIQIITPTRKGTFGTMNLNNVLQSVFNPPRGDKKELKCRGFVIREGDKVMQIRNNYDIEWTSGDRDGEGIFNGDMGIVKKITKEEAVILFDGEKSVKYPREATDDLELSYAVTVHKSQGSEFPVVIMPMYRCHRNLMSRNLFYTAVTRAKQTVVLVGRNDVIAYMTENNYVAKRYSGLEMLLKGDNNEKLGSIFV